VFLITHTKVIDFKIHTDALTQILKQKGFENGPQPGGIHLARSMIDRLLAEKELEIANKKSHQQDYQQQPKFVILRKEQEPFQQNNGSNKEPTPSSPSPTMDIPMTNHSFGINISSEEQQSMDGVDANDHSGKEAATATVLDNKL
jgi:hypothetical protein